LEKNHATTIDWFLLVLVVLFGGAVLALADSGEVPLEQQPPLPEGTVDVHSAVRGVNRILKVSVSFVTLMKRSLA
jgi:hypothetical protein